MTTTTPFAAILVAAGASERMGADKLWTDYWGRPAWRWGLDVLLAHPALVRVAIVVPDGSEDRFRAALPSDDGRCELAAGGDTRADSVIKGLWALTGAGYDDDAFVLVHDAARPAATLDLVDVVASAAAAEGGERAVVPVVALADSLKRVRGGRVVGAVERDEVAAAQTPQAATLGALRAAIEEAHAWGRPITDDAGALAAAGVPVLTVPGESTNRKLTEPSDIAPMRSILADRIASLAGGAAVPGQRYGIGFDAHRLEVGWPMRIGGLTWEDEPRGPLGHSDGDAALHAITDALLGAASLGDIGAMFPETDAWAGADSSELVTMVVATLRDRGWRPRNVDLTVAAARPAIAPRRDELVARIADLLGIDRGDVSVKGTTSDGLGFSGSEGIAAWAVASVERGA